VVKQFESFRKLGRSRHLFGDRKHAFFGQPTTRAVPTITGPGEGGSSHPLFTRLVLWHDVIGLLLGRLC
jgi:hypothetical protein